MDFRVLGPLEVLHGETRLPLGGPKQRAVLANLLACPGHHMTIGSLIVSVYGPDAAPSVKRSVHTFVSNLRHQLGDVIVGLGDGYTLAIDEHRLDSSRFEASYQTGLRLLPHEPEVAAHHLRAALSLWRGHPYAGVASSQAVDSEVIRLNELRLSTLHARIEADLALGSHHDLIGELEALVVDNPYNERFVGQHMLALYRAGRQREALRAFARAKTVLMENLGVDPGPELERLEELILSHDPSLDLVIHPRIERRAIVVSDVPDDLRTALPSDRDQLLARRDIALDAVLADSDGQLVGVRGTAAYASVSSVSDALEVARSLSKESLRVAVDFGEVEIADGEVSGPPIGRVARLVATSHPGQVVLSQQAQEALSATGQAGWTVTSLGRHRLDGIDEPLMIFQAKGAGLDTDYPPLVFDRRPPPVPLGHTGVAGYELREPLEDEGHSIVFRAYQHTVGREVTVRSFRRDLVSDPRFIRRFEAEAQRLAGLDHPHILPVLDYWREPRQAMLVSRAISERGRSEAMALMKNPDAAVEVICRIGAGLALAHDAGVVHGSLSLGSLVFDDDANPYLAGLGITHMTRGLLSAGDAPEPPTGRSDHTPAADVHSLGILVRDLLGESELVGGRRETVERAVQDDPALRYQDVRTFVEDLAGASESTTFPVKGLDSPIRNPYKGLNAFVEADATDFFGRDDLVSAVESHVASGSLTLMVGPSGIGKSSAVRAGLVPALRSGSIAGSEEWLYTDMFPGSNPFDALRLCLSRVASHPPGSVVESLRSGEASLVGAVDRLVGGETVLIVIDQLEELFTHVVDEDVQNAFLAMLTEVANTPPRTVRIVATLRADFFDRPLRAAEFGRVIADRIVPVPALCVEELRDVVRRPAERVGLRIDGELVEALAQDTARQPGGLPLLQHTLTELFEDRSAEELTLADYSRVGGLEGSIGRRAEEVYLSLSPEVRETVRAGFLRMVTVDEDSEDTRRRVRRAELEEVAGVRVREAMDAFGRHRLVTFDRDPASRAPTVEVAHESIFSEWGRLRVWIDSARDDLLVRRRVDAAAQEWSDSDRDDSYLLRGARLEQAEAWQQHTPLELTDLEREFLRESRVHVDAQRSRARRTRQRTVAGLSAGLVVVSILGIVAVLQSRAARQQALENRVAELSSEALVSVDEDPDLAILLALEAYETSQELRDPPREVVAALLRTVQESRLARVIDDGAWVFAANPNGRSVALAARDIGQVLRVYDLDTGALVGERRLVRQIGGIAYHPAGSRIAVTYATGGRGSALPALTILDAATLETVAEVEGGGSAEGLSYTDDGRFLAGVDGEGARIWDAATGYAESTLPGATGEPTFIPGSSTLVRTRDDALELADVETGETLKSIPLGEPGYQTVVAHPDGKRLAVTNWTGNRVDIVDWVSGRVSPSIGALQSPQHAAFTPDGTSLVVSGTGRNATVIDLTTLDRIELTGHGAMAPDNGTTDQHILVQSLDQGLHIWRARSARGVGDGSVRFDDGQVLFSVIDSAADRAAGVVLLPEAGAARAMLVELSTNSVIGTQAFVSQPWDWPLLSSDGRLAVGRLPRSGRSAVVDLGTGETVLGLRSCERARAVSRDAGLVVVTTSCRPNEQEDPDAAPRTGVVDLDTDELVLDLTSVHNFMMAAIGEPGTPAEDMLLVGDSAELQVWDLATRRRMATWQPTGDQAVSDTAILPITFSHEGDAIIIGYQHGLLAVFDTLAVRSGSTLYEAERFVTQGHSGALSLAQGAGSHLVTAGPEVRIRDLDTGDVVLDLQAPYGAVAMSSDGTAAYYYGGDGLMRRVPLAVEAVAQLARSSVTRGFTTDECLRFLVGEACTTTADRSDG